MITKYKGAEIRYEAGEIMLNVFASPEGEFPSWVKNDPDVGTGYIDGAWRAFLMGEAKVAVEEESHIYPCMCGGGDGAVCSYCGGLVGVKL
jgi:hypothetical protein